MLSRRELLTLPLAVGAASVLAACSGDEAPPVDPQLAADVAALERALVVERGLLAKVTDGSATSAEVLGAHVELLAAAVPSSSASPSSAPSSGDAGVLSPGELRSAALGHLADLDEVTGPVARLLASVAASDLALAGTLGGRG